MLFFIFNLLHQSMSLHVVQFWCCYIVVVTVWCCYMKTCRLYVEEKGQPDDQIATVLLSEESISESAYQPFLYSNCFQFILLILQTIWKQTDSHYNNYFTIGRLEDVFMNPVCPKKRTHKNRKPLILSCILISFPPRLLGHYSSINHFILTIQDSA